MPGVQDPADARSVEPAIVDPLIAGTDVVRQPSRAAAFALTALVSPSVTVDRALIVPIDRRTGSGTQAGVVTYTGFFVRPASAAPVRGRAG